MARPAIKVLDRIIDLSRPSLGELIFCSWGSHAFDADGVARPAATCRKPGSTKQYRVLEINIQSAAAAARKRTMRLKGTRAGRCKVEPIDAAQQKLLMVRLNLTAEELQEALAD